MELPNYATLKTETAEPHVLVVTLNRPEVGNAINTQMGRDLLDLWTRLTEDAGDVRCVVLTGAGERIFCSGGDLKERNGMSKETWVRQHQLFERQYWTLVDLTLPVIAAVNGHAYAGGLETALSCDFIYAVKGARFALTEVTLGIMPGAGGTQNLPRALGERRAKEIIMTGRPFSAQQAYDWGLANELCEPQELMPRVLETARTIAANAPLSVRQVKKSVRFGMQMELKTAYRFEVEAYNHLVETEDRYEGVKAFNEKRKPVFKGK
jgi:enoyl-CoA hydratase/carnithine racemase